MVGIRYLSGLMEWAKHFLGSSLFLEATGRIKFLYPTVVCPISYFVFFISLSITITKSKVPGYLLV